MDLFRLFGSFLKLRSGMGTIDVWNSTFCGNGYDVGMQAFGVLVAELGWRSWSFVDRHSPAGAWE
jgi:hypothetical protein